MPEWKSALRSLSRRPGFLLTSVLLLTLGVGAGSAFFSVVHTVLLKPLPYPDPERLVRVMEANSAKSQKESLAAPSRLEDWNRLNRSFVAIARSYTENVTDTSGQEPERLSGLRVSGRYFDVYGAAPSLGRTFTREEERAGGPLAVVISHGLWMRRYGGDPQAIKTSITEGRNGVMPPFGPVLGADGVSDVAHYVLTLSGFPPDNLKVAKGRDIFAANCAACHGVDGKGNPALGAPNLTDKIWLHGGTPDKVIETITAGRQSHMPAHKNLLDEARINLLTAYVYGLSHPVPAAGEKAAEKK